MTVRPAVTRTRRQLLAETKAAHNHPTYAKMAFIMGCGVQGEGAGSRVVDDSGRSYLAMFDQYGNQSLGYSHPRVLAAIRDQLDTGRLNSTKIMFEEEQVELTRSLSQLTDGRLPFAYLANGGGETIDNALKLARAATRRPKFITATGCFHGKTFATLSASGRPEHEALFRPMMSDFRQVLFGDLDALKQELDSDTAAVLLETIQAEAGVVVPPEDYLREVSRLCADAGALLILDEMQTAFGRCGSTFAFERFGVFPDLVCIGKAFGGGMLPISAVLGTARVWDCLRDLPSAFGSSLGGNPLSCRAALETLAIVTDPAFLQSVQERGTLIEARVVEMARRHPELIKDVRGIGMMYGLEFHDEASAGLILGLLHALQVTSTYSLYDSRVIRIQPPLVISMSDLTHGLETIDHALAAAATYRADSAPTSGMAERPVTLVAAVDCEPSAALALLTAKPRLLDPFARDNDEFPPSGSRVADFPGLIGDDPVVWSDMLEFSEHGVTARAESCWLWSRLQRRVTVTPRDDGPGCFVEIRVDWDTGSGPYEELLAGRLAHFVRSRLHSLCGRFETIARTFDPR